MSWLHRQWVSGVYTVWSSFCVFSYLGVFVRPGDFVTIVLGFLERESRGTTRMRICFRASVFCFWVINIIFSVRKIAKWLTKERRKSRKLWCNQLYPSCRIVLAKFSRPRTTGMLIRRGGPAGRSHAAVGKMRPLRLRLVCLAHG